MRKKGFSLIELLVVISVIAILMGIILPSVGAYRKRAMKAKTRADINQLSMALEAYKNDYRRYPSITGSTDYYMALNTLLYKALTGDENGDGVRSGVENDKHSYLALNMVSIEKNENGAVQPYLVDAYENRIGYWPYPTYHNRTRFNLWSKGSDGITGTGAKMGDDGIDDINNWK